MRSVVVGERRNADRGLRLLLALVLGGLLALLVAPAASAHAVLLGTTPADGAVLAEAPAEAVLSFNENVQLVDGSVRLFPGDGDPLTLDAHVDDADVVAALPAALADGGYALSYRVVSADGHPVSGAVGFTIGTVSVSAPQVETDTPAATTLAVSLLTAAQDAGLLAFAGLVLFERIVLRAPGGRRLRRPLLGAGALAALASILLVPVAALDVVGAGLGGILDPAVWVPGVLWEQPLAALIVLAGAALALVAEVRTPRLQRHPETEELSHGLGMPLQSRGSGKGRGTGNEGGGWGEGATALLGACAALGAPVLVGHSQTVEPRTLVIVADVGHLLAGAFWVGGVLGLLLVLTAPDRRDPLQLVALVQRFSRFALWSVLLLAASGVVMGILIVGSPAALVTTGYGLTLLLKLGIVIPIIAIAAYNRIRLLPAIRTHPTQKRRRLALHRTLGREAALLTAVLVVTGFLTNLSPDHEHHGQEQTVAQGPVEVSGTAQQLEVEGTLTSGVTGVDDLVFTLRYQGQEVAPEEVTIRASLPAQDLGPFSVAARLDAATGTYTAALSLPVSGTWELQFSARVSTFSAPIVTIPVAVP